ncbi:unnamed protein product [Alopecurus aequalis]
MAPARFAGPRAAAATVVAAPATSATPMVGKKSRKPRAPKEKPPGMSNKEWITEMTRLKTANMQRRAREAAQRQRQLAAQLAADEGQAVAEEKEEEEESLDEPLTPAASAAPPVKRRTGFSPLFAGWSQATVASPSPSPRPSPHWYVEGDPLGGFNPNLTFPHHAPMMFGGSPGYASSPSHHRMRGALQTQDSSFMDELIATGSMAAAAHPGFLEQAGEFFTQGGGDYVQGGSSGTEEVETEEGEEAPPVAAPAEEGDNTGGRRRPRRPRKDPKVAPTPVEPRIKWTHREDVLLAEAWKTVSLDPIVGANQAMDNYWKRVKTAYDERRMIDPDFAACVTERGQKAMANHWANIQAACNKWHGIQEDVAMRPKSGANREMELVRMLEAYKNDENADLKFLHVFVVIEGCEKWAEVRRSIRKGKEYVPDEVALGASEGRPLMGHKKAKAARDGAPEAAKLQASIETCIADAQTQAAKREELAKQRWVALMANSQVKLDLLRTGTVAKKRNHDLAFLTAGDPTTMDPEVRAWFMEQRRLILSDIIPAPAPDPTPTDTSYATPATTCDSPASSASPAIDLEDAAPVVDLEDAAPVVDLEEATASSAPAPTPKPVVDVEDDAEASPTSA